MLQVQLAEKGDRYCFQSHGNAIKSMSFEMQLFMGISKNKRFPVLLRI